MKIELDAQTVALIEQQLSAGKYTSAEAFIADAVRHISLKPNDKAVASRQKQAYLDALRDIDALPMAAMSDASSNDIDETLYGRADDFR